MGLDTCTEAVIRFHRFNHEKEACKLYRSKLMLYLPWRDESTDLLDGYMDFRSRYEDMPGPTCGSTARMQLSSVGLHGPPRDQVATGAVEQEARHRGEGVEEERSIEQEDLDANARLFQQQQASAPLPQRFTAETNRELLSPEEYRTAIRQLNSR